MDSYKTIQNDTTAEICEKKSRFISSLSPIVSEEQALEFLDEIRREHRMARHNPYAYVIKEGGRKRYSDDGEPQRTAGLPLLEVLEHAQLTDVIVVVTRYFGGILLGTGGLVRAYTKAAQEGLMHAKIVTVSNCVDISLKIPYTFYEQMIYCIKEINARTIDTEFTDEVTLAIRVENGRHQTLIDKATELTHGLCEVLISEPHDAIL